MSSYRILSSDDHVYEPVDLWTTRMEPAYRDRGPRVQRIEDGTDYWFCDGQQMTSVIGGTLVGVRFEDTDKLILGDVKENITLGGFIPEEHVKDMAIDGIDVSILYATAALMFYETPDSDLLTEICRCYNNWVAEFCGSYPKQLKGIAALNTDDVDSAIRELERCAHLGLAGAMISVHPHQDRSYDSPIYEPFWAAAESIGMPLSLHVTSNRPGPGQMFFVGTAKPAVFVEVGHWMRMSLAHMIFSGVFERHPKLQVGSVEHELAWVPHFLERSDYTYTQRVAGPDWHRFSEDMLPGDYFHRNVFVSFQEDAVGIQMRNLIGVDNMLWGSDYPHAESTFPKSREILEDILSDCSEEDKAKIVGGNCARIYNLD